MKRVIVFLVLCFVSTSWSSPTLSNGDLTQLNGTWLGRSLCVTTKSACSDETVQYRIHVNAKEEIVISADKLVYGKYEWMGDLTCQFEPLRQLLRCAMKESTWLFRWDGKTLLGHLFVPEWGIFQHIYVSKTA